MATIVTREDFEGAGNGATVGTATSSFSSENGTGIVIHSTEWSISGTRSMKVNAATTYRLLEWTLTQHTNLYMSFYIKTAATDPGANAYLMQVCDSLGNNVWQLGQELGGDLRVRDASTTVDTAAVTNSTVYRVDVTLLGAGNQTTRLYTGANLHSTNTANAAFTMTGALTATSFYSIRVGNIASVAGIGFTIYMDYFEASDTALPAPYSGGGGPATPDGPEATGNYIVKRRTSGVWVLQKMRRYKVGATPAWPTHIFNRVGDSPAVSDLLVPSVGAWFGGECPDVDGTPTNIAGLNLFEGVTGNSIDICHFYRVGAWSGVPSSSELQIAERAGKPRAILLYNWKVSGKPQNWAAVAAGTHDARIDTAAQGIKSYPHKVFLAIQHEPENDVDGANNTAANYVSSFRRVVDRFRALGVTNVVFVVNYMSYYGHYAIIDSLYPGDSYVDWIAGDPYSPVSGGTADLAAILTPDGGHGGAGYHGFYNWCVTNHPTKPIMLAEWGVDFANGTANAAATGFFNSVVPQLKTQFPKVKALVYWSIARGSADYRIWSPSASAGTKAAISTMARDPYFNTVSTAQAP